MHVAHQYRYLIKRAGGSGGLIKILRSVLFTPCRCTPQLKIFALSLSRGMGRNKNKFRPPVNWTAQTDVELELWVNF